MINKIVAIVLIVVICVELYVATITAPTDLEPALLASGLSHLQLGRFEAYRVNPPLVKIAAAVPVEIYGYQENWSGFYTGPGNRTEFSLGGGLVKTNREETVFLITLSRISGIVFFLLMIIVSLWGYRWLTGCPKVSIVACMFLISFDPNFLGHGALITNDIAASAAGLMVVFAFMIWLKKSTWWSTFSVGFFLGFAQLIKMSWIILYIFLAVFFLIHVVPLKSGKNHLSNNTSNQFLKKKYYKLQLQLLTIFVVSLYVLNLGYFFDGSFKPISSYEFVSQFLNGLAPGEVGNRFRNAWFGRIPIPLPEQYILGFDTQKKDFEDFPLNSYLAGTWQVGHGWWYYYFYGMLVKVPHVTQLAILFGLSYFTYRLFCHFFRIPTRFDDNRVMVSDLTIFITPALCLFALVSSQDEFSIHFRYILPCIPFFIILGCIALFDIFRSQNSRNIILAIVIISSLNNLRHIPHFIPYFNELSGGPSNGWRHMLGSSYDWGQDMILIKGYLAENNIPLESVRIKDHDYRYWECIYPDIWQRQSGPFKYDLVSANNLTHPEKCWLKRFNAGQGIRICYTAWLFPIPEADSILKCND